MDALKETKPFDLEHARAGAPYACRSGFEAHILKWDARGQLPLIGCFGPHDTACEWSAEGKHSTYGRCDLVMVPIFHIDRKPIFAGTELEWRTENGWKRVPVHPQHLPGPIPGHIWNNIKMPLKAAIELWLAKQTEFDLRDLRDRAARDMAVAEAVLRVCVREATTPGNEAMRLAGLDLATIIAKVPQ